MPSPRLSLRREQGRDVESDAGQLRQRHGRRTLERDVSLVFAVAQIALAVVSLTAAGLMTRSFVRLMNADLSFRADNLVVAPLVT